MPMHEQVGKQDFVQASINTLLQHLNDNGQDAKDAIASTLTATDAASIEAERLRLLGQFQMLKDHAASEESLGYVHYASRFSLVGAYQSVLSKLFSDIPGLQGYGNRNPIWLITVAEQALYTTKEFFRHVYTDVHGLHQPLLYSLLQEWKTVKFERATYPTGTPSVIPFPDRCGVALLADWGGDNPAAKKVADTVLKVDSDIAIHLGDIYYGGVKEECEAFLANWPTRMAGATIKPNANFALNGNHEMYTGGDSYFNVVLPTFQQTQPFFCLENANWRLIGLDTAYNAGRLRPNGQEDPLNAQWDWLVQILKNPTKKANILLTHHQPVSAHKSEFAASAPLRDDIAALLATEGIDPHAIFGWFFGHEHRCTIYDDNATGYMARLIGSGCIPHTKQTEEASDPGCTPAKHFNKRETTVGSGSAISMHVDLIFADHDLVVRYTDEDGNQWGSETWDARPGSMAASSGFAIADASYYLG